MTSYARCTTIISFERAILSKLSSQDSSYRVGKRERIYITQTLLQFFPPASTLHEFPPSPYKRFTLNRKKWSMVFLLTLINITWPHCWHNHVCIANKTVKSLVPNNMTVSILDHEHHIFYKHLGVYFSLNKPYSFFQMLYRFYHNLVCYMDKFLKNIL